MRALLRGLLLPAIVSLALGGASIAIALPHGAPDRPAVTPLGQGVVALAGLVGGREAAPLGAALLALTLLGAGMGAFTRRLTGNTLAGLAAAALIVASPAVSAVARSGDAADQLSALATLLIGLSLRLLPQPVLVDAPRFGKREIAALSCTGVAALGGTSALLAPLAIVLFDLLYATTSPRLTLRRSGPIALVHLAVALLSWCVTALPATAASGSFGTRVLLAMLLPGAGAVSGLATCGMVGGAFVAGVLVAQRKTAGRAVLQASAAAVLWVVAAEGAALLGGVPESARTAVPASVGISFAAAVALWRLAMAITQPRRCPIPDELPIPSVPALRDFVRRAIGNTAPQPVRAVAGHGAAPAADPAGWQSMVEASVAGAVSSTIQELRLAFRGPQPAEAPGTPEQVLWNRLLAVSGRSIGPSASATVAVASDSQVYRDCLAPDLARLDVVAVIGRTPWSIVDALARDVSRVILVERGAQDAARSRRDLARSAALVLRQDGVSLSALRDRSFAAVLCFEEASLRPPAEVVRLLREIKRVLRPGGLVALAWVDLDLTATQAEIDHRAAARPGDAWPVLPTTRAALEALCGLGGLRVERVSSGVTATQSVVWLRSDA